jgi:hypothetical protein
MQPLPQTRPKLALLGALLRRRNVDYEIRVLGEGSVLRGRDARHPVQHAGEVEVRHVRADGAQRVHERQHLGADEVRCANQSVRAAVRGAVGGRADVQCHALEGDFVNLDPDFRGQVIEGGAFRFVDRRGRRGGGGEERGVELGPVGLGGFGLMALSSQLAEGFAGDC